MAGELMSRGFQPDESEKGQDFGRYALSKIVEGQRASLKRFGVSFDHWFYESSFRESKRFLGSRPFRARMTARDWESFKIPRKNETDV